MFVLGFKGGIDFYNISIYFDHGSLACQITSPFNKKIGFFCKAIFLILFAKITQLIVEWGSHLASQ